MRERFKRTEICQVCAKTKNVCQTCINDLETGQSLFQRDAHIELDDKFQIPKDFVNKDYWAQLQSIKSSKIEDYKKSDNK